MHDLSTKHYIERGVGMRWIYTDSDGYDRGVLLYAEIEHEESADSNALTLTMSLSNARKLFRVNESGRLEAYFFIYDDDDRTVGGLISRIDNVDTASQVISFGGYTFRGIMSTRIMLPYIYGSIPDGWSLTYTGGSRADIAKDILDDAGLLKLAADDKNYYTVPGAGGSGTSITTSFERYTTVMQALDLLYAGANCRVKCEWSPADRAIELSGEEFQQYPNEYDGESVSMTARCDNMPLARLVCVGQGEGNARTIVNLYIQADGTVGESNSNYLTLPARKRSVKVYNYTGADSATQLKEDGKKMFNDILSAAEGVDLKIERMDIKYGDTVGATESNTGFHIEQKVIRKTTSVEVGGDWEFATRTVDYELGSGA